MMSTRNAPVQAFMALAAKAAGLLRLGRRGQAGPSASAIAVARDAVLDAMEDEAQAGALTLDAAFARAGAGAFAAALAQPVWTALGFPNTPTPHMRINVARPLSELPELRVATPMAEQWIAPAEAVLCIRSKPWRERLCAWIPPQGWESRIEAATAFGWHDRHVEHAKRSNAAIPAATPFLRLCGRAGRVEPGEWLDAFALAAPLLLTPAQDELAAGLFDLGCELAGPELGAVLAWSGSRSLQASLLSELPDPSGPRARPKSL